MAIFFYYVSAQETASVKNAGMYVFAISIPILFFFYYMQIYAAAGDGLVTNTIFASALFFGIMFALYFYFTLNQQVLSMMQYIFLFLILAMTFVALALVFVVFGNYLKSLNGWLGALTHLVFYIPCLIIDFYNYVIREIKLTTHAVFLLLVTEIILILCYIYVPKLFRKIENRDAIVLLAGSTRLSPTATLITGDQLEMVDPNAPTKTTFRKNYGISLWVNLNSMPSNHAAYAKETPIFRYTDQPFNIRGGGKPMITYFNDTNDFELNQKDKLTVYFTNQAGGTAAVAGAKVDFDKQKWNYVVFNYESTHADLFINGVLAHSFTFSEKNPAPTYNGSEIIAVGSDAGLEGAACNVKYHKHTLTKIEISNTYNLLHKQNPPTNFLS
jgi:hypothetical protein